jgi:hypothetical protein
LKACGANKHGKARTNDDKRRAVQRMLEDQEWQGWSNYEVAKHCGVGEKLVRSLRPNRSEERTYRTKHGTVATMDTTRIGQRGEAPSPDLAEDLAQHVEARLVVLSRAMVMPGGIPGRGRGRSWRLGALARGTWRQGNCTGHGLSPQITIDYNGRIFILDTCN